MPPGAAGRPAGRGARAAPAPVPAHRGPAAGRFWRRSGQRPWGQESRPEGYPSSSSLPWPAAPNTEQPVSRAVGPFNRSSWSWTPPGRPPTPADLRAPSLRPGPRRWAYPVARRAHLQLRGLRLRLRARPRPWYWPRLLPCGPRFRRAANPGACWSAQMWTVPEPASQRASSRLWNPAVPPMQTARQGSRAARARASASPSATLTPPCPCRPRTHTAPAIWPKDRFGRPASLELSGSLDPSLLLLVG